MSKRLFAALFSISVIVAPVMSQTQPKDQQDTQKEKRMEWFANAKLGIFIHWGIYSVKGVSESWSFFNKYLPYEEYMSQKDGFTASKYDPKAWVDLIKESGARYTVITTKHQDATSPAMNSKIPASIPAYELPSQKDLLNHV